MTLIMRVCVHTLLSSSLDCEPIKDTTVMSIDISTHQLAEQTWKALGGKVTLDDILKVWHAIGE